MKQFLLRMTVVGALLAASVAFGGCKKKPADTSKANKALFKNIAIVQLRADSVFNMRDTLKVDRGHWTTPGSTAAYEAYLDGAVVRFMEEREDRGEFGTSDNRYYFDPAEILFFYEDRGEEKEPRGSLPPMSKLIQRTVIFAPDGHATWGRRLADGVAGAIPDSQVAVIADRSRRLMANVKGMTP